MFKHLNNIFCKCYALFLFVLFFVSFFSAPVFADNTLTLSISDNSLSINMLPQTVSGEFVKSSNINISISLSGTGGYYLGIKAGTTGTNATRLVHTTDNTKYFSSITSAISQSTFSNASNTTYNNQWGYLPSKFDSASNTDFRPAPDENGDTLDYTTTDNASGTYTLAIGARANNSTAIGTYSNTFVIMAVANQACNPNATSISEALCMQDMNDSVINSMVEHQQYQLKDNRDWKTYYVAKVADGRVWMTQNLDLDLETTPTNVSVLTSKNTDLNTFGSQNYTTANGYSCSNASTTTNCTASGEIITYTPSAATANRAATYGSNNTTSPASYDAGTRYRYPSGSSTTDYYSIVNCTDAHDDGTCPHYHIGNYYNFTAAVASNSLSGITTNYTAMGNSVCPSGWRLPNGQESSTGYAEVNYSWVGEGIVANYVTRGTSATYLPDNATGYSHIRSNPLFMANAGYISSNGSTISYTSLSYSYYWTNTIYNNSSGYDYYFLGGSIYPSGSFNRGYGVSVRCVARQSNTGSTTVTFNKNANDATGSMTAQVYNADTLHTLPTNGFSRSGYAFDGWNTKADGSGTSYADAAQYYAVTGNMAVNETLYAQWAKIVTLTFNVDSHTNGVYFDGTVYTNGQTAQALQGKDYNISGLFGTKYGLNNWSATSGSFESNTISTVYTVANNATISVTSKVATVDMTTITNSSDPVSSTCKSDPITPELVYDPRDNEAYYVARLCDGNYWMLDNLRLDLSNSSTLNGLSTTNTNATAHALSCLKTGLYNGVACSSPYTTTAVVNTSSSFNQYTQAQINVDYTNTIPPVAYGVGSDRVGVYYNYCAVSAGSYCYSTSEGNDIADTYYDLEGDICPAGWHLPTAYSTNIGELSELSRAYNIGVAHDFNWYFSIPFSGYYSYGSQSGYGTNFQTWSSTHSNNYYRMIISITTTSNGTTNQMRQFGLPIRCILDHN